MPHPSMSTGIPAGMDRVTSLRSDASQPRVGPRLSTGSGVAHRATTAANIVSPVLFPMYVMPVVDLLNFDILPVHEELMERKLLEEVHDDRKCIHFVSQRWLGANHPDPDSVKLRRLQDIFSQIIEQDPRNLFDNDDWDAFSTGSSSKRTLAHLDSELKTDAKSLEPNEFQSDILQGYVWWDYMSVPQKLEVEGASQMQKLAVSSIPHYIERSAYFWVVVPDAVHQVTKRVVGYEDWQSRGWCRLEEWGNVLATRVAPPLVVTGAKHIGVIDSMDFLSLRSGTGYMALHAACQGRFTCCDLGHQKKLPTGSCVPIRCDKEEIKEVLSRMHRNKVNHLQATGKKLMYSVWKNSDYSVLAGTSLARKPDTVEELLRRLDTEGPDGKDTTRKPLAVAITCGSPDLVKKLLSLNTTCAGNSMVTLTAAQVGHVEIWEILLQHGLTARHISEGSPMANITPLDRCARVGHQSVCRLLLRERAEVGPVRMDNGWTPLHSAAEAGQPELCRLLLAAHADTNRKDARGRTPLMLAAQRLTLFGRSAGKAPCARTLLEARADLNIADVNGRLPEEVASEDAHHAFLEVCRKFREERGPEALARQPQGFWWTLCSCFRL